MLILATPPVDPPLWGILVKTQNADFDDPSRGSATWGILVKAQNADFDDPSRGSATSGHLVKAQNASFACLWKELEALFSSAQVCTGEL